MYRILATSLLAAVFTMTGCPGSDAQDPGCLTSLKEVKFTAPSGNSSLVSMQFHAVDCNGKPVSNLDIGSVRAVEIVNGDVVDLSPTETKANFYPKHRSYATTVAFAIDFSASIYSYPDRLKTLRDSVIAFGKTLLAQNDGLEKPQLVVMPTAFDGQPDTVMILNGVFGAPAFIDGASFEQAINQQLQCGYSGNLLLRRNQNGAPMPLCVDTSTNLNGAAVEAIKMASMGTIWRSFMVQPDYESKVAVVFSDGKNEANLVPLSTVQATLAQNPDTKVYSVGLKGQELDTATLKTIGRDGAFWADSMADLQKAFGLVNQEIINMANSFYMFQYCTAKRSGSITFELGVLEQMRSPGGAAPAGVLTHQFTPTSAEYVCPL